MAWHKRLLDYDPETRSREWYWSDPDTGEVALETEWDVGVIAEDCKGIFNTVDERAPWKGDWHHVASIPMQVIEWYKRHHGVNLLSDRDAVRQWCNDPDNRAFRVRPGRV